MKSRNLFKLVRGWSIMALMLAGSYGQVWSQTNQYLAQLGKQYHVNDIKSWSEKNDGINMTSGSNARWYGVALPKFGMVYHHDFNKVNGATIVDAIEFGKASILKKLYSKVEGSDQFVDSRQQLPFGFRLGMSKEELEAKVGRSNLAKLTDFEGTSGFFISSIPGYRFLDIHFWFENGVLVYLKILTTNTFYYRQRIEDEKHPMRMEFEEAMAEKSRSVRKLRFASINNSLDLLFKNNEKPVGKRESMEVVGAMFKYDLGADSVRYEPGMGYTAVWCTANIKDKQNFFDQLVHILKISLEKGYRNDGYPDWLVAPYRSSQQNNFNHYFHHADDRNTYRLSNKHILFHTYMLKQTNEVVMQIFEPNEERTPRPKVDFLGVCTPEDPDLLLDDEAYLAKKGINVAELKAKFSKRPGNALFRLLGEKSGSDLIRKAEAPGLEIRTDWDEKESQTWVDELMVRMDNLSRGSSDFKGKIPLGLSSKMKMSQIQKVLPDFSYRKVHTRENWQQLSAYESIGGGLTLYYRLFFSKGKLYWIGLSASGYQSREWQILKTMIFPELQ